ncbi:hypothetical protein PGT21_002014 [Puccinia graminis f. sp. tritici]|uniref:Uncharacterized protein n=1 Tax=Puccinia graminis f. sp. tritici TaxID=56615 RepID=A0A5B0P1G5_PUCGR|nr:hypothetical protein PGT21_002014 [Puccinia graminis f. sp. tritici]KAA1129997.1 hypothetical protein PGTUg99_009199 [Puccinia graminis f. sp. tritici]
MTQPLFALVDAGASMGLRCPAVPGSVTLLHKACDLGGAMNGSEEQSTVGAPAKSGIHSAQYYLQSDLDDSKAGVCASSTQ